MFNEKHDGETTMVVSNAVVNKLKKFKRMKGFNSYDALLRDFLEISQDVQADPLTKEDIEEFEQKVSIYRSNQNK